MVAGHRARLPAGDEGQLGAPGRYSAGSRANRAAAATAGRGGGGCVLGRLLQHRGDLGDVDHVEVQRPGAGGVDRAGPVAADQPEQPVDLPHPGPRQVGVQQPLGIDADRRRRAGGRPWPARRRPASRRRSSPRAGRPGRSTRRPGCWRGMGLDQLPAVEQLHQRRVGAGVQVAAQVLLRHRIQRPADLDVEVAVDLHPGEHRHVIGRAAAAAAPRPRARRTPPPGGPAIVPWIRIPATSRHHASARACASARPVKCSPAKKFPRTYCTARSTLGLPRIVNYTRSARSVPTCPGDAPVPPAGRPGLRVRRATARTGARTGSTCTTRTGSCSRCQPGGPTRRRRTRSW